MKDDRDNDNVMTVAEMVASVADDDIEYDSLYGEIQKIRLAMIRGDQKLYTNKLKILEDTIHQAQQNRKISLAEDSNKGLDKLAAGVAELLKGTRGNPFESLGKGGGSGLDSIQDDDIVIPDDIVKGECDTGIVELSVEDLEVEDLKIDD